MALAYARIECIMEALNSNRDDTMTTFAINAAMQSKLAEAGIPHESIKVFGVIRQHVYVTCTSRNTADRWALLLNGVFPGSTVACVRHKWPSTSTENKGTSMRPTKRSGWRVAVAGRLESAATGLDEPV